MNAKMSEASMRRIAKSPDLTCFRNGGEREYCVRRRPTVKEYSKDNERQVPVPTDKADESIFYYERDRTAAKHVRSNRAPRSDAARRIFITYL